MASKRNSDSGLSPGAAPARAKSKSARKHKMAAPETTVETTPAPAAEVAAPVQVESAIVDAPVEQVVEVAVVSTPSQPVLVPTFEDIAQRAYFIWAERGFQGGSPEEDWNRAEQELLAYAASLSAA